MSTASPVVARFSSIFGLTPPGLLSLAAVLAVFLVVSLPRLEGLARLENEGDARATAELLVRTFAQQPELDTERSLQSMAGHAALERALSDGEWLDGGRLLRRHGYLFELCPVPAPLQAAGLSLALTSACATRRPRLAVRAWPWSSETGRTVFVASECGTVLAHPNSELLWRGIERHPDATELRGWRRLP